MNMNNAHSSDCFSYVKMHYTVKKTSNSNSFFSHVDNYSLVIYFLHQGISI